MPKKKTEDSRKYMDLDADDRRFLERAAQAAMALPVPGWFLPLVLMPPQPEEPSLPDIQMEGEAEWFDKVGKCMHSAPSLQGQHGQMAATRSIREFVPETVLEEPSIVKMLASMRAQAPSAAESLARRLQEYAHGLCEYSLAATSWTNKKAAETQLQWPIYYAWQQLRELTTRRENEWGEY